MKFYLLLLFSSLSASLGQVLFKLSKANLKSFSLYAGFILYGISSLFWVYSLKFLPLSKVYPFTFLTYALVLIFSYLIFNERLSLINFLGVLLIVVGVFLTFLQ